MRTMHFFSQASVFPFFYALVGDAIRNTLRRAGRAPTTLNWHVTLTRQSGEMVLLQSRN